MIIDFHTHSFPDSSAGKTIKILETKGGSKAFTNGTRLGLVNSMKDAGIDCSIILPVLTKPDQFQKVNEFAVKLNEEYEGNNDVKLISFGGIHPDSSDYKYELKQIVNLGLKGIKLHPDYQDTMFDDIKYMRIIDYASELGLIIVTHAGLDIGYPDYIHCTPQAVRKVIDEVAPEKLVLAHFGGYRCWDDVEELLVGQNVYFDTAFIYSAIEKEQFLRMLDIHGADKVLFATDSPWGGQKQSIEWFNNMKLSSKTLEKILYKNAVELLKI